MTHILGLKYQSQRIWRVEYCAAADPADPLLYVDHGITEVRTAFAKLPGDYVDALLVLDQARRAA